MPLLKTAFCCDLRTGVITMSILCLFCSVYNLCRASITVSVGYEMLKHNFQRAGLSSNVFNSLIVFLYTNIALQGFGIIAVIIVWITSCKNSIRLYVLPFIFYCIMGCFYCGIFMIWVNIAVKDVSIVSIKIGIYINILLFISGAIIDISYYEITRENYNHVENTTQNNGVVENMTV